MQRRNSRWLIGTGLAVAGALTLSACGSGSGFGDTADAGGELTSDSSQGLNVLIGSSGDAETASVNAAVAAWSESSGTDAKVSVASDLNQQLAQGFAAQKPADVFYLSTDALAGYASNGSLLAYGDELANKDDFYPSLVSSFTYDGEFYCAPKDFSTLGLVINTDLWAQAGLTDADIPTTWDELAAVSKTLTTDTQVGLALGGEYARLGAFMAQAGGSLMNEDNTEATANSAESVAGLEYAQTLLNDGVMSYASEIGAGWGGEAFGKQLSAMTIEGNWITGAMKSDFPEVNYTVAELPAGPEGQGTLQFTNCWGIAADSDNVGGARELVEHLTSVDSQMAFAQAFGVMPSVQSAADQWSAEYPDLAPFIAGGEYAQNVPAQPGAADAIGEL
ncbi:MAG TPA: extracellular solute-binding protein, partial [Cryobacterium sp.]|nr:extracellular solute-binding protein [Cryobacterium sp.]